jgi:hypothetical protein
VRRSIDIRPLFHTADRFSSGRLRYLDIASNAAGDIVEIRSALVEIREKSIRFQHEMHKRRRLSHELATD